MNRRGNGATLILGRAIMNTYDFLYDLLKKSAPFAMIFDLGFFVLVAMLRKKNRQALKNLIDRLLKKKKG